MHMPSKALSMDIDIDLPLTANAVFIDKCRSLAFKINKMIKKPHIYFHESAVYVKYILVQSCELQNCYEIESDSEINVFFADIKLQAHLIYLLSMLVPSYTGKTYQLATVKSQLENILRAAMFKNLQNLLRVCHEILQDPSLVSYEIIESFLSPVKFLPKFNSKINIKTAEVTFPIGEKVVNECEVLNVQGHGSCNMHCVIELPDGTIETSKAVNHSNHLNSYIRIHKPINPVSVQICFAVLVNLADFALGPGLHNETLKLQHYLPVSPYINLTLKPSSV